MPTWIKLIAFGIAGLLLPFFGYQFVLLGAFDEAGPVVCVLILIAGGIAWYMRPRPVVDGLEESEEADQAIEESRRIREIGDRRFK